MSNYRRPKFVKRPIAAAAIGLLTVPALGGIAYAAANSVGDKPKPQIVIPASSIGAAGNPATHDAGDDRSGRAATPGAPAAPRASDDNLATHDLHDDRGVDNPATHDLRDDRGVDNSATHDAGDDRSGQAATVGPPATPLASDDNPATHDVGDDRSGLAQIAVPNSGSGGTAHGTTAPVSATGSMSATRSATSVGSRTSGGGSGGGGHDDLQPHR